ncbi:MAG TPA: CpsB/CapC family capsule biosynthesis tyrosine phosphatase [Blastocatellia bacterium]|nr:CpsB/CapC family capsule biosynthesis tyrosine phosphatase [Blastocatellia bacterium]
MIDIHSHILPEVDDGSHSLEESLEMCRASAKDGVNVMVATPHAHDGVHTTHDPEFLRRKVGELNDRLEGTLRVVIGCELRFTHDVVRQVCETKTAPTIAGGPYVLIEFPHTVVPPGSERPLFELMSNQITPIIAHPERNQMLIAEPERFFSLIEMGVLGQMDTGSITGQFGRKVQQTVRVMLEHGLIHFIASDCHNTRNRLPGLSEAVALTAEVVGEGYARAIASENPLAVVEGRSIPSVPDRASPKKKKRWLLFGRG